MDNIEITNDGATHISINGVKQERVVAAQMVWDATQRQFVFQMEQHVGSFDTKKGGFDTRSYSTTDFHLTYNKR